MSFKKCEIILKIWRYKNEIARHPTHTIHTVTTVFEQKFEKNKYISHFNVNRRFDFFGARPPESRPRLYFKFILILKGKRK